MRSVDFKLLAICSGALAAGSVWGMTNLISGAITNDATWSGTNLLQGTVVVHSNVVVTIDPGTMLLMNTAATLRVEGQLLANGTSNQPITFTRATTTTTWGRIVFARAADSRLRHCVIEYANCAGSHLDYYDNDCNTNTPAVPRNYHEAVVAVATRLDIEGCVFRNLPNNTAAAEGDAIAIISDDPQNPGTASAHIANCQFLSIGQGIHTRFSYVLVEGCLFSGKRGDNDDVDLYGESLLRPIIRNNVFLSGHEDKINPTRCSAIIVGNLIMGSDDHGIVLRDKCLPTVMNNLIYNCTSAGIAVQNQCSALIVNNTIVNCQRGIRFFDHDQRWGPPYCLLPGSGSATIINCIIWDCPTPLELADSPYTEDRGSHASVYHSDIEGGQAAASVSANSTVFWGPGNLNVDPQFVGLTTNNYRLRASSPCIDAGTNQLAMTNNTILSFFIDDFDGLSRPLDGNGDGVARFDIGAYEFLLATADSNGDGIPDGWTHRYGFNLIDPDIARENPDGDPYTTFEEWVADTDPTNALSFFHLAAISNGPPVTLQFPSSSNRFYTLAFRTNLTETNAWTNVPGQVDVPGNGGPLVLTDTHAATTRFYRVGVRVP